MYLLAKIVFLIIFWYFDEQKIMSYMSNREDKIIIILAIITFAIILIRTLL
jgi:hypothetical protein